MQALTTLAGVATPSSAVADAPAPWTLSVELAPLRADDFRPLRFTLAGAADAPACAAGPERARWKVRACRVVGEVAPTFRFEVSPGGASGGATIDRFRVVVSTRAPVVVLGEDYRIAAALVPADPPATGAGAPVAPALVATR